MFFFLVCVFNSGLEYQIRLFYIEKHKQSWIFEQVCVCTYTQTTFHFLQSTCIFQLRLCTSKHSLLVLEQPILVLPIHLSSLGSFKNY